MRHRKVTFKIGRTGSHCRAMVANQVCSLFLSPNGQIQTTVVKAKGVRQVVEKMITFAKKGDLHHRRLAVAQLHNKTVVKMLFDQVAPRYADRNGGYTRIIKLNERIGDGAQECLLQLVESTAAATPVAPTAKDEKPAAPAAPAAKDEKPATEEKPAK